MLQEGMDTWSNLPRPCHGRKNVANNGSVQQHAVVSTWQLVILNETGTKHGFWLHHLQHCKCLDAYANMTGPPMRILWEKRTPQADI